MADLWWWIGPAVAVVIVGIDRMRRRAEGRKVARMVRHIESSQRGGKSDA